MLNKIKYCFFLFCLYIISCQNEDVVSPNLGDYTADFDTVWTTFDLKYPLFNYKNISWDLSYQQYRDQFSSITTDERNIILKNLLGIFRDAHINITTADGEIITTYPNPDFEVNFNREFLADSISLKMINNNWGWTINNNVGYLRIHKLTSSEIDTLVFGNIIDSLRNTEGLILDIREEYGGSVPVCKYIWNRFASEKQIVGFQQYRNGPDHDDFAPLLPVFANPSDEHSYNQSVVVLIGEFCGSAGEILANSLSYFDNVTLVGDTTMGAVEAPSEFSLSDGTKYTVPIVAYLDINYQPLEWRGVAPDIYIDPILIKNNTNRDLAIEKALEIIQSKRK